MGHLIIENLRKVYKNRAIVDNLSLMVKQGQIVGLLGPNGAGKTTSFYMTVGLISTDKGKIALNGKDISKMPVHQRARLGLSYLPQEPSIFRKMSVRENILAVLQLHKLTDEEIDAQTDSLLISLGIKHIENHSAMSLSGGERRRVEIARCLANNPIFILLDEPFAGIDPIAIADIQKIIKLLKARGIGVLITDHNVRETLDVCDYAYIISEGRICAEGHPHEIIHNAQARTLYLGEEFKLF